MNKYIYKKKNSEFFCHLCCTDRLRSREGRREPPLLWEASAQTAKWGQSAAGGGGAGGLWRTHPVGNIQQTQRPPAREGDLRGPLQGARAKNGETPSVLDTPSCNHNYHYGFGLQGLVSCSATSPFVFSLCQHSISFISRRLSKHRFLSLLLEVTVEVKLTDRGTGQWYGKCIYEYNRITVVQHEGLCFNFLNIQIREVQFLFCVST